MVGVLLASVVAGCGYLAPRRLSYGPAVKDGGVLFRFYAPAARRVQLAGNWPENNWGRGDGSAGEANIGLMEDKDGDGVWRYPLRSGLDGINICFGSTKTTGTSTPVIRKKYPVGRPVPVRKSSCIETTTKWRFDKCLET